MDGGSESHSIESEEARHREKIIKILHAAVREVECNDGFELLGSHSISWVCIEGGRGLIEKDGILYFQGAGDHGVSDADIDLDGDDSSAESGRGSNPKGAMGTILTERLYEDVFGIEAQSIIRDRVSADIANDLKKGHRLVVGKGEKIKVVGRSERVREPCSVEHGALEDEKLPVMRDTEPKEKPLK